MSKQIDLGELHTALQTLNNAGKGIAEALYTAQKAANGIISSEALQGQTGSAIANTVNNVQAPLLEAIRDSYARFSQDFDKQIKNFKSHMGESSDSATYHSDALTAVLTLNSKQWSQMSDYENSLKSVYSKVSDIISLSSPSNSGVETADSQIKSLTKQLQSKLGSFKGDFEDVEEMLADAATELSKFAKVSGLSYTKNIGQLQDFYATYNGDFASEVQQFDDSVQKEVAKELESASQAKIKQVESWEHQHPLSALKKMTPEERKNYADEFAAYLNKIGISISSTALKDLEQDYAKNDFAKNYTDSVIQSVIEKGVKSELRTMIEKSSPIVVDDVKLIVAFNPGSSIPVIFKTSTDGTIEQVAGKTAASSTIDEVTEDIADDFGEKIPVIGTAIDFADQTLVQHHDLAEAAETAPVHAVIGMGGMAIGMLIPIPGVDVAAGLAIGTAGNMLFDAGVEGAKEEAKSESKSEKEDLDNSENIRINQAISHNGEAQSVGTGEDMGGGNP